jgi:3-hydroxyacyl-[acyl-carrier-protein] dehydratase
MRFFLIDKITQWHVGTSAEAIKNVALSEDFFDDHFPRRPVMPGVLILEGMAQLSGLLLEAGLREKYGRDAKAVLTVLERTKFRDMVRPGDTLTYRTRVMATRPAARSRSRPFGKTAPWRRPRWCSPSSTWRTRGSTRSGRR